MDFYNDTATTEIYTLSLRDALPIAGPAANELPSATYLLAVMDMVISSQARSSRDDGVLVEAGGARLEGPVEGVHQVAGGAVERSEEHTSELQSRQYLVCRLLLQKKK